MKLSLVQFKNATIIQNNQTILSDVNIEVQQGDFIFLIGKTGTGKSSLIKTLYADLPLKSGIGIVSDFNLAEINQREIPFLRRKLGVVFQDFKLLPDRSIFENLSFVLKATGWKDKEEIKGRIEEVLNSLGVSNLAQLAEEGRLHELNGSEQGEAMLLAYEQQSAADKFADTMAKLQASVGEIANNFMPVIDMLADATSHGFALKGILIGIVGTLLGILLGTSISINIDVIVPFIESLFGVQFLSKDIYYISTLPSKLLLSDVVFIGSMSIFLSIIATIYPSIRATRIEPATALKYE